MSTLESREQIVRGLSNFKPKSATELQYFNFIREFCIINECSFKVGLDRSTIAWQNMSQNQKQIYAVMGQQPDLPLMQAPNTLPGTYSFSAAGFTYTPQWPNTESVKKRRPMRIIRSTVRSKLTKRYKYQESVKKRRPMRVRSTVRSKLTKRYKYQGGRKQKRCAMQRFKTTMKITRTTVSKQKSKKDGIFTQLKWIKRVPTVAKLQAPRKRQSKASSKKMLTKTTEPKLKIKEERQ